MGEPDRDVRFAAAEIGAERRGLEETLLRRRRETQHQLAEADDRLHERAAPERAAVTASATRRARAVMALQSPFATSAESTSAPPKPTATAPAASQLPTFSGVTPPVGIRRRKGMGASTALM